MKETINESAFIDGFMAIRKDNFSYEGLRALYDYLTQLEDDLGEELDFDIIAFCCDYSEYESVEEYLKDYNTDIDKEDYVNKDDDDLEGYYQAVKDEIRDKTTLIEIEDKEGFIIGCY